MNRLARRAALALLLALALAACAAPAAQAPTPAPAPTPAELSLTDALGRQVRLPAAPRRIVSLAPAITEILFAIGAGPQLVGDTQYCNYPPAADALPEVGGFSAKTISVEAIVGLRPDLVIAGAASQAELADALTPLGIPTIVFDPTSFEDVYADIVSLGYLTGHADGAEQVVADMRGRVAAVQAKVGTLPADQRPTVFYEVYDEPLMSAGPETFIGQMIGMAGATSIFADASEDYPQVSAEAIIARNPAVIVGPDSHGDKLTPALIAARPGWDQISAVRDGRVYLLPADPASRPGPRLADALERLAAQLYPELFAAP